MITLFITRHGRTNFNERGITSGWDNSELTEEGKRQATAVGQRLKESPPSTIFSSTLQRALNTAELIQAQCGGEILMRDDLKEKNLGALQGIPEAEYQKIMKAIPGDVNNFRPESGESRNDVVVRVGRVIEEIKKGYEGKTVLIVGHHSTNRSILSVCLGGDPSSYTQRNGTLSRLQFDEDKWTASYIDKALDENP